MNNTLFVVGLAALTSLLLTFAFKTLPKERWQILAAIPREKNQTGKWDGINLTWYGVLNANAYVVGAALLFVLLGSVGIASQAAFVLMAFVLVLCVPSSRIIARTVEKKPFTFTVGGASFVGIVATPWAIVLINQIMGNHEGFRIHAVPALSALAISYAAGEGLGRLACISFGCCYGKPLSACPALLQRLFRKFSFVFTGSTKKVSYAGGMEGERMLPIQAITSVLYLGTSLTGILLYLHSHFLSSFILCIVVTQVWRTLSETLRADYRGTGKMTAYQVMAIVGTLYSVAAGLAFSIAGNPPAIAGPPVPTPDIAAGLSSIWDPGMLLFFQGLWALMFFYTGRSMVTGSILSFHVHKNRV